MNNNEKIFNIPVSKYKFFRGYIELLKPFLSGLTSKEADVVAELMYQNYLKQEIPNKTDRFKLILESSNRRLIEQKLEITSASFRNILCSLKTKKIIDDNNELRDIFLVLPDDTFTITFNFKFDDGIKETV